MGRDPYRFISTFSAEFTGGSNDDKWLLFFSLDQHAKGIVIQGNKVETTHHEQLLANLWGACVVDAPGHTLGQVFKLWDFGNSLKRFNEVSVVHDHNELDRYYEYVDQYTDTRVDRLGNIFVQISDLLKRHDFRTLDRILMIMPVERVTPECMVGIIRYTAGIRSSLRTWYSARDRISERLTFLFGQSRAKSILVNLDSDSG